MSGLKVLDYPPEWYEHVGRWEFCERCPLATRRVKTVLGVGSLPCDILFVGEAPGRQEDLAGIPFVGPSGKWLSACLRIVRNRHKLKFTQFVTNVVACRPCDEPGGRNRPPMNEEIRACSDRISELREIAQPKGIVLIGNVAKNWVHGINVPKIALPHPSYIIRQPSQGVQEGQTHQWVVRLVHWLVKGVGINEAT